MFYWPSKFFNGLSLAIKAINISFLEPEINYSDQIIFYSSVGNQ